MARSRKRREFKPVDAEEKLTEERFRFPLDLDDDIKNQPVEKPESHDAEGFVRRDRRRQPHQSTNLPDKNKSSFILKKAREIPSPVHGLKKDDVDKNNEPVPETPEHPDDTNYDDIQSVIIRDIVKERNRKKHRDNVKREAAVKRRKEEAESRNSQNLKSAIKPLTKNKKSLKEEKIPTHTMGTPVKLKASSEKRQGPTVSLPSMNMLGRMQAKNYAVEEKELSEAIVQAFNANGVPASINQYKSNGIIGTHELKLNRNFRISNISKLKAHILPYLPVEEMRVVAPIIGTSHIGVEIPLKEPMPIYFSTLFQKSSLKLRKNDYKFVLGKIVDDQIFSYELPKAGHLLVYSGNNDEAAHLIDNFIISMLMNHTAHDLKFKFVTSNDMYDDYKQLNYLFSEHDSIRSPNALDDILQEVNSRSNQFRRAHVRNISSFNKRVSHANKKSVIVIVIDDFSELIQSNNHEAVNAVVQILKKGKPLGIHLLIRHGDPAAKVGYELLQLLQTKVSFKDDRNQVIKGAEHLVEGNDMLIQIPTSNKPLRVNRGEIEKETKDKILAFIREQQP
ncbi:DNA translocase FtsK [Lacicoccus qingdaonensis]|uniref:DNA segregation ATPase FtsK/SpoIIIE, S-DNA-T family n=1 Tax=Lacicoccus qingdaonensis TaxID=576118 RepID=A0A1G9DXP5_9BACL|nr:DNA translocase FtsK [Salinicoccus qingdaonensis]SDK68627.1 DNA segregation ATPase FtsK/SpoIIIE, S-DNA-T family [Salinicoccus qingdaonensis]